MRTVLAALDRSLSARPVLTAAEALARILGAQVAALHVQVDGASTPRSLAQTAGVPLRIVRGTVIERLVEAGEADDVAALVIGARGVPTDPRPLGATAVAVATTLHKPVLVVPPDAEPRAAFRRVLVPLEGTIPTSLAPRFLIELAPDAGLDILAVHVLRPDTIPPFTDQPQHEQTAWAQEFLARYCPWGTRTVQLETHVGRSEDLIPRTAVRCGCDLIALGWSQDMAIGRARVVRAALERTHLPVVLVPVPTTDATRRPRPLANTDEREDLPVAFHRVLAGGRLVSPVSRPRPPGAASSR
jgi:nucleotide-binding universal stress UspA family protein